MQWTAWYYMHSKPLIVHASPAAGALSPGSVRVGLPTPSVPSIASRVGSYLFGGGKTTSAALAPAPSVGSVSKAAAAAPQTGRVSGQGLTSFAQVAPLPGPSRVATAALTGVAPKRAPGPAPARQASLPHALAPGGAPSKQAALAPARTLAGSPAAAQGPRAAAAGMLPAAKGPPAA